MSTEPRKQIAGICGSANVQVSDDLARRIADDLNKAFLLFLVRSPTQRWEKRVTPANCADALSKHHARLEDAIEFEYSLDATAIRTQWNSIVEEVTADRREAAMDMRCDAEAAQRAFLKAARAYLPYVADARNRAVNAARRSAADKNRRSADAETRMYFSAIVAAYERTGRRPGQSRGKGKNAPTGPLFYFVHGVIDHLRTNSGDAPQDTCHPWVLRLLDISDEALTHRLRWCIANRANPTLQNQAGISR